MRIELRQGNVLGATADALWVAIDGASAAMEGNIARQLSTRWGDDTWDDVHGSWEIPLPAGRASLADAPPGLSVRHVVALSILPHDGAIPYRSPAMRSLVVAALVHAARLSAARGARTVATALPLGGQRLSVDEALAAVVEAGAATTDLTDLTVVIWSALPEHHAHLVALAPTFGLRDAVR